MTPPFAPRLKVFILDEAWKFFTVPVIRNYLIKAAKTWRKHNGVLIMATQSPEDLKESNLLPLLDSFPTKIFLANADADYGFYTEKFHLNPREVELIQTLIPKREGLIKTSTMGKKVCPQRGPEKLLALHQFPQRQRAFHRRCPGARI